MKIRNIYSVHTKKKEAKVYISQGKYVEEDLFDGFWGDNAKRNMFYLFFFVAQLPSNEDQLCQTMQGHLAGFASLALSIRGIQKY
jgi:hypothetical protein